MDRQFIEQSAALYKKTLLEDVVPFWMRHGVDAESGALNNCLDDAGNLLSRDRYLWSQGRGLWTFSALYNRIEPRQEWLKIANGIAKYLYSHGRDEQGKWMYRLDSEGNILDRDTSIYVDGFVMTGLGEYYLATGDKAAAELALDTFKATDIRLKTPGSYGIAPYVIPEGIKTLGIPMIFSFFYYNLGKALNNSALLDAGYAYAKEVLSDFYMPEIDMVTEFATMDGKLVDSPKGRVTIPGHVIEGAWFLISIFEQTGDTGYIKQCCDLIKRHIELGWDEQYGGIRLAIDREGKNDDIDWQKPDCKPWWVQIEALVATAYAALYTEEEWPMLLHRKVQEYVYSHYPVPTGEWTQWLDRFGKKGASAALPVKDPFHLPRGMMYLIDLFKRLQEKQ